MSTLWNACTHISSIQPVKMRYGRAQWIESILCDMFWHLHHSLWPAQISPPPSELLARLQQSSTPSLNSIRDSSMCDIEGAVTNTNKPPNTPVNMCAPDADHYLLSTTFAPRWSIDVRSIAHIFMAIRTLDSAQPQLLSWGRGACLCVCWSKSDNVDQPLLLEMQWNNTLMERR